MRRAIVIAVVVIVAILVVWSVIRQRPPLPPPEEIGEVERVREITLYFASRDAGSLVPEYRRIVSTGKPLETLRKVIEAVISGPTGDGVATLPSSVRVRAVYIHEKTAYLDFSNEIVEDFFGGSAAEYMLVASIVQTACANFPEVEAVRILVEGQERDTLGGHLRISKLLRPEDWR